MKKAKKVAKAKKAATPAKRAKPVARMKAKPISGAAAAKRTGPSRRTAADRAAIDKRAATASKLRRPKAAAELQPLAPALARLAEEQQNKKMFGVSHHSPEANLIDPKRVIRKNRHRTDFGDLQGLARSIDERGGLIQPIALKPNGELIDGERRIRAWALSRFAGELIPYYELDIDLLVAGEWDANAYRKNFTPSEAVAIKRSVEEAIAELAKQQAAQRPSETRPAPGRKAKSGAAGGRVADKVATATGVSRVTLRKAEAVVDAAEQDPQKFGRLREDMDRSGRVDGPFRRLQIMQASDAIKAAPPALPDDPIAVASIDCPWPFEGEAEQEEIDAAGRSLRPYPAMAIKSLCHFMSDQVAPRLAPDCAVWLWVTNHHLIRGYAHHVIGALGFEGRAASMLTWVKDKIGRGAVLRDRTEHCILLTRGKPVINVLGEDPPSTVLEAPRRENSRKPDAFYRLVERVTPATRYVSIFSTGGEGDAWIGYGDQVRKNAPAAAAGDEREEWKALGAIEAGVSIEGPIVAVLRDRGLIGTIDGKPCLTDAGADRLIELDKQFDAEKTRARDVKLLQILETIAANPEYEPTETDEWFVERLAELIKRKPGGYRSKPKTTLTAKGRKRMAELAALFPAEPPVEQSSPPEDPQPADRAGDDAPEEKEIPPAGDDAPIYRMPDDVIDAIENRGGHTVSNTIDWSEGENGFAVATCPCGWSHRADRTLIYSGANVQERAVEAHWREVLGMPAAETPAPAAAPRSLPSDDYPEMPADLLRTNEAAE